MATNLRQGVKPLFNTTTKCLARDKAATFSLPIRAFSSSAPSNEAAVEQQSSSQHQPGYMDPATVFTVKAERKLLRLHNKTPVGSRRRRAATLSSSKIPFEQLPYQCFQEARKILASDRDDKIHQIENQRARIARLKAQQVSPQDERQKETRIVSMQRHLEELKILADVNDPTVKRIFEDGHGMSLALR